MFRAYNDALIQTPSRILMLNKCVNDCVIVIM